MSQVDIALIKGKLDKVAGDILSLTRSKLLVNLRFLDTAIGRLEIVNDELVLQLATNGKRIYFSSHWVIETYKEEEQKLNRAYLHTVLHCIFHHPFVSSNLKKEYWNLASDIAIENIISEMNFSYLNCNQVQYQDQVLVELKEKIKPFTAEKIYRYFIEEQCPPDYIEKIVQLFYRDSHILWWTDDEEDLGEQRENVDLQELIKEWDEISKMMDVDLDTLSDSDSKIDDLTQNLKALNRDRHDYNEFLRKFSVRGEDLKINDDEFDYIYYTYGLEKYKNMPLIEPLEYKEIQKICDFVIAIDTSGSVQGELVQKFLDKTYSILMLEESFFKKINIRIIQCDDTLQEEVKITSKEELDRYLVSMKIKGFGGTDFRPVFKRVEQLIKEKEFKNLKGLIYFTDGYGIYPEKKPSFDAAFIYLGYDAQRPVAPIWAIKLALEEEQLTENIRK